MSDISTIQSDKTFAEVSTTINEYLAARDWLHDDSRSLAMSIVLEAAELMEHYQWSGKPVGSRQELGEELADILIYAFQFAHANGIDMAEAIGKKLKKSGQKYPAEAFKNKTAEERKAAWIEGKRNYKKEEIL